MTITSPMTGRNGRILTLTAERVAGVPQMGPRADQIAAFIFTGQQK